jgi:hypothetical protein
MIGGIGRRWQSPIQPYFWPNSNSARAREVKNKNETGQAAIEPTWQDIVSIFTWWRLLDGYPTVINHLTRPHIPSIIKFIIISHFTDIHPYSAFHRIMENSLDILECELIPALRDSGQNLFFTLKNSLLHLLLQDSKWPKVTRAEVWWIRWVRARAMCLSSSFSVIFAWLWHLELSMWTEKLGRPLRLTICLFWLYRLGSTGSVK